MPHIVARSMDNGNVIYIDDLAERIHDELA